jgi:hypothetical protein
MQWLIIIFMPDWQKVTGGENADAIVEATVLEIKRALKIVLEQTPGSKYLPILKNAQYRRNFDTHFLEDSENIALWEFWNKVVVEIEIPYECALSLKKLETDLRNLLWVESHIELQPQVRRVYP